MHGQSGWEALKSKWNDDNFYYIIRYLLYAIAAVAFKGKHLVYKMILVLVKSFTRCQETFQIASSAVWWVISVKTPATVRRSWLGAAESPASAALSQLPLSLTSTLSGKSHTWRCSDREISSSLSIQLFEWFVQMITTLFYKGAITNSVLEFTKQPRTYKILHDQWLKQFS